MGPGPFFRRVSYDDFHVGTQEGRRKDEKNRTCAEVNILTRKGKYVAS